MVTATTIRIFIIAMLLAFGAMFQVGISQHYMSNVYAVLSAHFRTEISRTFGRQITEAEISAAWSVLVALQSGGACLGAVVFQMINQKFGRVRTIALVGFVFGLSGNLMKIAAYWPHLWPFFFLGKLFSGIVEGCTICGLPVFFCEIAPKPMRSLLGMIVPFGCAFTTVLATIFGMEHILGGPDTWIYTFVLNIVVLLGVVALVLCIPPSPVYLLANGRPTEARRALRFYHGTDDDFDVISKDQDILSAKKHGNLGYMNLLRERSLRKQVFLSTGISIAFIIYDIASPFSTLMFTDMTIPLDLASRLSLGIRIQSVLVFSVTVPIVGRVGNRIKFLIGTLLVALTMTAMSGSKLIQSNTLTSPAWQEGARIAFASLMYFNQAAQDIGVRSLFFVLVPEMFPYHYRSIGKSLSYIFYHSVSFAIMLFLVPLLHYGKFVLYLILAAPLWYGFVYCYFFLPETQDKELYQIYDNFQKTDDTVDTEKQPILPSPSKSSIAASTEDSNNTVAEITLPSLESKTSSNRKRSPQQKDYSPID